MSKNARWVFIAENSRLEPVAKAGDNKYVFEGPCAVFNIENRNNRIYTREEYIPRMNELQESIDGGEIVYGELDHPESFDVSMKNVSHVVEKLWVNENENEVWIRVKLLSTSAGRELRAIADDGYPINISSRAAGLVEENKNVKIKKIFTFDAVANPGFKNAQLRPVTESLGIEGGNVSVYDITENAKFMGSKDFQPVLESYRLVEFVTEDNTDSKNTTKQMSNNKPVSVEALDQYMSEYTGNIQAEFAKVREELAALKESREVSPNDSIQERLEKFEEYLNYLAENVNSTIAYCEHIVENVNELNDVDFTALREEMTNTIEYSKYLAKNLDENISYSNYLSENLSNVSEYTEYLAENLDKSIDYSTYLAEKVDTGIQYSEHISEHLNNTIDYTEYVAEKLGTSINERLANSNNTVPAQQNGEETMEPVTESLQAPKETPVAPIYTSDVSDKIAQILESVNKQKTEDISTTLNYQFTRFLSNENRARFSALDETQKKKVANALDENAYFSESDVMKIWEAAINEVESGEPKYLQNIPEDIKPLWESLSEREQAAVRAQAEYFNLHTTYQIETFWNTRAFANTITVEMLKNTGSKESLNESAKSTVPDLGYDLNGIAAVLRNRFA
jgi:hypothetical protein